MSLGAATILGAALDHARTLGKAERIFGHEPKNAPGKGISIAFWVENLRTVPGASGLASTTVRLELSVRVYVNMLKEPQDAIDVVLLDVVDALMGAYTGGFTFGGLVRNVDLFGEHGDPFAMEAGFLGQDKVMYRVMNITLPLIVNDLWSQAP